MNGNGPYKEHKERHGAFRLRILLWITKLPTNLQWQPPKLPLATKVSKVNLSRVSRASCFPSRRPGPWHSFSFRPHRRVSSYCPSLSTLIPGTHGAVCSSSAPMADLPTVPSVSRPLRELWPSQANVCTSFPQVKESFWACCATTIKWFYLRLLTLQPRRVQVSLFASNECRMTTLGEHPLQFIFKSQEIQETRGWMQQNGTGTV